MDTVEKGATTPIVAPEHPAKRRERLEAARTTMSTAYDRLIATLSTGAFAVSIVFYREIAPNPTPVSRWFLFSAWVAFATSLLVVLFSFWHSERSHRLELNEMDFDVGKPSLMARPASEEILRAEGQGEFVNAMSGLLFAIGAGLLLTFAAINLFTTPTEVKMSEPDDQDQNSETTEHSGSDNQRGLVSRPPKVPTPKPAEK